MKKELLVVCIIALTGCSSNQKLPMEQAKDNHVGEEKIISRIDEMTSRPSWLKESEPFRIENGKVLSLGMTVIPGNDNLSAAYRISENNSKASISHAIEQRLDFVFQNAEEGTTTGASQAKYIGAEASKLTTNSLHLSKRYWEKISTVQESGQVVIQYKVYVLSEMPEQDFKVAIQDAIRKSQGKQGISAEFAKKVEDHWQNFVNGGNATPSNVRKPSTTDVVPITEDKNAE